MHPDIYHKYYLNADQVKEIVNTGLIVFDTSALLELYFYSEETLSSLSKSVFPALNGRLWIPSQVYYEFLKNIENVEVKPENEYRFLLDKERKKGDGAYLSKIKEQSENIGKKEIKEIEGQLCTLAEKLSTGKKHPYIQAADFKPLEDAIKKFCDDTDSFKQNVASFVEDFSRQINDRIKELESLPDAVKPIVDDCFDVGEEYSFEKLVEISREGKFRYSEKIPPGYMDEYKNKKDGLQKYGDLFAWKQILDIGKEKQLDILLVINDVKEDWWDKEKDSPRFELLKEYASVTGKKIWTCTTLQFLHLFELAKGMSYQDAIDEIKQIENEKGKLLKADLLYRDLLNAWLASETSAWIEHELVTNKEWEIFGYYHIFKGRSLSDGECLIMLNILEEVSYARVLHSFENLWKVVKYYESVGLKYAGFQFILIRSKEKADEVLKLMRENPKLYGAFDNSRIKNAILCYDNGLLRFVTSNYQIGTREPSSYDPRIRTEWIE